MDQDRSVDPGDFDLEDPNLEEKLVNELKAQGIFDQFRKDCLSDVDTKVRKMLSFYFFSIFNKNNILLPTTNSKPGCRHIGVK